MRAVSSYWNKLDGRDCLFLPFADIHFEGGEQVRFGVAVLEVLFSTLRRASLKSFLIRG